MGKNFYLRSRLWQKAVAVQKAAVEKDMEAVVVQRLFPQIMGLTPLDGPAPPIIRQEAAETMRRQKAKG